ncbi:NADH-quinone oxidoreductase subunit A [Haloglycomyces albus]|uniref:NADH-quinone oxidoreductase subunit A n=1 Tax=Haloglycomyces albus TaxID=526067 RepID=UPI00046D1645|nr:NADH-quinone oxidoreductase subunit A [Haloglycomyces albus]
MGTEVYVPLVLMFAIGLGFGVVSLIGSRIIGPRRVNRAKIDPYECGIEPPPEGSAPKRFPIKFYLTAMLFIVFDIEIMFLIPWAVYHDVLGLFGFWAVAMFISALFIAYAYEWRRGGLEWD